MTQIPAPTPPAEDDMTRLSGWDALLDDLFGLNVRAVRTVLVAVTRPARLFTAARDADWAGRFTPSLRLVFTIIAATVLLRFLWAGDDSPLMRSMIEYLRDVPPEDLPVPDSEEVARTLVNQFMVLTPFTYFGCHFISSLMVRVWGKGTPAPVRIRLYFCGLLPALTAGLLTSLVFGLIPDEQFDAVTLASSLTSLLIYALTIFFGLSPVFSAGARIWRAGLFAMVAGLTDAVISMITFLLAFVLMYV